MGLGEGHGGLSHAISVSIDTYTLVDQHSYEARQVACSLVPWWRSEPSILETALKTGTEELLGTTNNYKLKIAIGLTRLYYAWGEYIY